MLPFHVRKKQPVCNKIWAATWQNQQIDCAASEDSDQSGHPPSLIRVFAVRIRNSWVLSYPLRARMPRLIWVFAVRTLILLVLPCRGTYTIDVKLRIYGPRQANLVLIAYASSEGSGEPAHTNFVGFAMSWHIYYWRKVKNIWTASSEFGTYRICESEGSGEPDTWPLWMSGHAQLKFVMTECSKTQIRLTGFIYLVKFTGTVERNYLW